MTKKEVKDAVFFAQQDPEVLAKIILDLIDRVTALEESAE